jgi:carboxylesterase
MEQQGKAYPTSPGAEAWSAEGRGTLGQIGLGLIHGFTGSPRTLRPLAERLAERGFRVELPRLLGHGTHPRDMARTRYADWRSEVQACVARLQGATPHVCLVGLSMGGTLCLDVASSATPPLSGVVSINAQILNRDGFATKLAPCPTRPPRSPACARTTSPSPA